MTDEQVIDIETLQRRLMAALVVDGDRAWLYPKEVELQFPRILEYIVEHWKTPELDDFFDDLIVTPRAGRQGFPEKVALELFHLATLHASYRLSRKPRTPWDWAPDPNFFNKPPPAAS